MRHFMRACVAMVVTTVFAAEGRADLIDFTPGFGPTVGPITYQGVTFTNQGSGAGGPSFQSSVDWSTYFDNVAGASLGNALNDNWGVTDMLLDFATPVNSVSILLSTTPVTTWTLEAYDAGLNLLGSTTATMPGTTLAVVASLPFSNVSRLRIFEASDNGHITLFDDLRFTPVPEPSSLALLSIAGLAGGAVGFGRLRRRRSV